MWFLRILLLLSFALAADVAFAQLAELAPRPELSPEDVVQYQVAAFQRNDDPKSDAGIERAFRFASPSNQQATGPLEHFVQIVKGPVYAPLLNNRSSSIVGAEKNNDRAEIVVKIVALDGRQLTYVFSLSKQKAGDFHDCWMTDGVAPLKDADDADPGVTM